MRVEECNKGSMDGFGYTVCAITATKTLHDEHFSEQERSDKTVNIDGGFIHTRSSDTKAKRGSRRNVSSREMETEISNDAFLRGMPRTALCRQRLRVEPTQQRMREPMACELEHKEINEGKAKTSRRAEWGSRRESRRERRGEAV